MKYLIILMLLSLSGCAGAMRGVGTVLSGMGGGAQASEQKRVSEPDETPQPQPLILDQPKYCTTQVFGDTAYTNCNH